MFDSVDFLQGLLYGSMWTFLCILSRIGPMLVLMPPLQGASVPNRVKVMIVLMVSFAMTPIVMEYSTPLPGNLADIILGLVKELLLGLLFGSSALIIVTSLQIGGQVISSLASLDVAQAADPTTQESITVVSQMLSWIAMILFVTLGGHRVVIGACVDSFATYPAGGVLLEEYWLLHLHELFGHSVAIGLRAAAPPAIALLLANFVTALIGRTLPQLNIIAVGFNLNVSILLIIMTLSITSIGWVFQDEFVGWIEKTTELFPAGGRG
ncbi:MAG: flagellar biosynthetic protein FliR [Pirellula sp.]|jgi:flagellar biosynthetic protein FliR|nr:flagellar biosynthetic protein FliR [Pirellula sp.]